MKIEWIFEETAPANSHGQEQLNKMTRYFGALPEWIRAAGKIITIGRNDLTMVADIEALVDRIETAKAITISLDAKKFSERGLSKKMKLNVYRVIQEQLGNIAKFSHATEANICLRNANHKIILDIRDNGKPADLSQRKNGVCITDVLACAEMNNGRATLESGPGLGSRLQVEFSHGASPRRKPAYSETSAMFEAV